MVDLVVLDLLATDDGWTAEQSLSVSIGTTDSGSERRVRKWPTVRREYSIPYSKLTAAQWVRLMEFHELRGATERGFLILDVYRAYVPNETIAVGDGATKAFQLTKTVADAANSVVRTIRYPVPGGTVLPVNVQGQASVLGMPASQTTAETLVTVGGTSRTDFSVSPSGGVLTFSGAAPPPGAPVVVTFFAYVPVRFLDEKMSVKTMSILGDNTSALIELLNE